jgi:molybdopterin converting factor small subunit
MTVTVKLFAVLRDMAGVAEVRVTLGEHATAEDAGKDAARQHPSIAPYLPKVAYAVNLAYAPATTRLCDGDEVALIPAVSGGSM